MFYGNAISILKNNKRITIGAEIKDTTGIIHVCTTNNLKENFKTIKLSNAIITKDGFVKSKKGFDKLPLKTYQK